MKTLAQLYVDKAALEAASPGMFAEMKSLSDVGDIVGAAGSLKRTEKGELSVVVSDFQVRFVLCVRVCLGWFVNFLRLLNLHPYKPHSQVLTKSLLPLPDKWHGLQDVEKRYRQR